MDEIEEVLDRYLLTCYQSWFGVYGALKPKTEEEFLSAIYKHFRLAYAIGFKDGVAQGRDPALGPLMQSVAEYNYDG